MMLTQRISALAHDLARQCHVGSAAQPEEKTSVGKTVRETSHRYSLARRRKLQMKFCACTYSRCTNVVAAVSTCILFYALLICKYICLSKEFSSII